MIDPSSVALIAARLDRLPATRTIWTMVAMLSLGTFFEFYDLLYTGSIAPGLVKAGILTTTGPFGLTGIAGFLAALFSGLFLGTLGCGLIADRFGRRPIFTWSLVAYTVASVAMAFQTDAVGLDACRFAAGLGLGVEIVTIGTFLTELVPKAIRGRAFAVCFGIGFCAVPTAAFLSYLLVPVKPFGWDGWRFVVLAGALAAIVVWWLRLRLPESPRWLAERGRLAEAEAVLARIENAVAAEFGRPLPVPAPPAPGARHARFADIWVPPLRRRTVMMLVFHLLQTIGFYGFANWVPTLLIGRGIGVTQSLAYTSIIALAAPAGPLLGFLFADRFERKHVLVAAALTYVACGLLFARAAAVPAILALGIGLTLASNTMSFTFFTYQSELFPTATRARAVGFVYSWSRFSAIFTGFLISFVLARAGVSGVFLFISAVMFAVALVIGLMGPRTRDLALEEISG